MATYESVLGRFRLDTGSWHAMHLDLVGHRTSPRSRRAWMAAVAASDALAVSLALVIVDVGWGLSWMQAVLSAATMMVSLGWAGAYDRGLLLRGEIPSGFAALGHVLVALSVLALTPSFEALPALFFAGFAAVLIRAQRSLLRRRLRSRFAAGRLRTRTLVVGSSADVEVFRNQLQQDNRHPFEIVAVRSTHGRPDSPEDVSTSAADKSLIAAVDEAAVDAVVILGAAPEPAEALRLGIWELEAKGVPTIIVPLVARFAKPDGVTFGSTGISGVVFEGPEMSWMRLAAKSVIDKVLAAFLLVLLSPVFLVIAIAVRLDSEGPVFFRQQRVGKGGTLFTMTKFRTMDTDAEEQRAELITQNIHDTATLFKIPDDPRVTDVGKLLRRYSLDELPQLVQVLQGHMSLVGPRPPLLEEVLLYPAVAHRRFRVKPGLTGLWQVSGRSDLDPEESINLDVKYVEQWSPGMDTRILARTAQAVISGPGAY